MATTYFKIWEKSEICRGTDLIFVTVGNDFRSFNRLLRKVDDISSRLPEPIIIQRGYSTYIPKNAKFFDFIPFGQIIEFFRKAKIVISHAGIGTIILCQKFGTPLIIVPRRKEYGEHLNNHQMEIVKALMDRNHRGIYPLDREEFLEEKILEILKENKKFHPLENTGRKHLIITIRKFIEMSS